MIEGLKIRSAKRDDVESMMALILELAIYEKAGDEVALTTLELQRDGFDDSPAFRCIVAERDSSILGLALLYERYSTWKGSTLYLEDLIVTESARGQGIGKALLYECIAMTKRGGYKRLEWQVLDWNEPAIEFYKKMGVELDSAWINCRMRF